MVASAQVTEMVPVGRLAAGDKTHEVRDEDEEEQRGEEGHVLLEAVTDDALAHVVAHELVTVLDGVDELVRRDERELAAHDEDQHQRDDPADDHPQNVLGDSAENHGGIEGCLKMRYLFRER